MEGQGLGVTGPAAEVSYSLGELYSIWDTMANFAVHPRLDLPPEMKRQKRARRSGIRVRNRLRKIMGNMRSIVNKVDELGALVKYDRLYRQCSLLCFTESWLNDTLLPHTPTWMASP